MQIAPDRSPPFQSLDQIPVVHLKRVGSRIAERLGRLGIHTVQDLLFHLPVRYQDRTRLVPIGEVRVGEDALIEGEVSEAGIAFGRRRSLKVWLADNSNGGLLLRFFHFSPQQVAAFKPGTRVRCYGEVRQGHDSLEMVHPECRFQIEETVGTESRLTPIYPSTEGLQQSAWRGLMEQALAWLEHLPPAEYLPKETLAPLALSGLVEALRYLHHPPLETSLIDILERRHPAFLRLAFEELAAHQVSLRRMRAAQRAIVAPVLAGDGGLRQRLRAALPFRLTEAQERVVSEIEADLIQARPMQRLLQGDVGAGKTVVPALAALRRSMPVVRPP